VHQLAVNNLEVFLVEESRLEELGALLAFLNVCFSLVVDQMKLHLRFRREVRVAVGVVADEDLLATESVDRCVVEDGRLSTARLPQIIASF
jgi:hypothetical protein